MASSLAKRCTSKGLPGVWQGLQDMGDHASTSVSAATVHLVVTFTSALSFVHRNP